MHVVSEDHAVNRDRRARVRYFGFTALVGVLLLLNATGVFETFLGIDTALFLTLLAGYKTFYRAIADLLERKISADLAIVIAAIAATLVGEYLAAAEAMFIMLVGEGLEAWAAGRTEAAIHRFVEQLPHHARVLRDDREVEVHVEDLVVDDVIVVRAGERIAADGVIVRGASSIDESPITGESNPRDKEVDDEVFSGTLNGHGLLHIRVTSAAEESTLARLIALVEQARDHHAPVVRLADKYAQYFLPVVLLIAAGTWYFSAEDAVMRAVTVLIVACPCALILATPAAVVAGIGGLARRGILARGGTTLQTGATIDTVVFDKTGTITTGQFQVLKILTAEGYSEDETLRWAAEAEAGSDHPLAKIVVERARQGGWEPATDSGDARIVPGRGAECEIRGRQVRAGNEAFLAEQGVGDLKPFLDEADRLGATAVLVAVDDRLAGAILVRDTLREGVAEAIHELEHLGIQNIVLLTGDRRRAADAIAREAGIHHVEAELLPEQKLDRIKQLQLQGRKVAMIGDGVNDAPALAAADIGLAIAGSGADIAAEAADVVDLNPTAERLPKLFEVSRETVSVIWQNIILFAGVVNVVSVYFASTGVLGPVQGAVVHQISSIFVMLNSVRLLRIEPPKGKLSRWARFWRWTRIGGLWRRFVHALEHIDPAAGFAWLWERRRQLARPALALLGLWWLSTATFVLEPHESGVVERFGRKTAPYREPGLNWKLPWPVEQLRRIEARRVRTVEIGFRTAPPSQITEPPSYEWNAQHRGGRIQPRDDEALMLTGDQNMIEMTAVVHYELDKPDDFLFRHLDPEATIRVAAESSLRSVVNRVALDDMLTVGRRTVEQDVRDELQGRMERYQTGALILDVRVQDVHPSVEVVDAFREVAGALEEKSRLINQAEAYRNEQIALARGQAKARLLDAKGYKIGRGARAEGDAKRFTQLDSGYRVAPGPNSTRLYLEAMEEILPRRRKLILDGAGGGRRTLYSIEDGVLLAPPGARMSQPPPPQFQPPEEP